MRFKFWSLQFNQWFIINQLFIILTTGQSSFSRESYFNRFLSDHPYFPSGHYPDHLDDPWATSLHHGYYGSNYPNSNSYGPRTPNGQATPNGRFPPNSEGQLDQSPVNGQPPLPPGQPPLPPGQPPLPPGQSPAPPGQPQAIARCDCKAEVSAAEKRMRREMSEQEGSDDQSSPEEEESMQESRSAKLAKSRSIEASKGSLEFICQRLNDQKNGQKLSDERLFDQRVTTSGQGRISQQIVQEKSLRLQDVDSRYRNVLPPPTTTTSPSNQPDQEEVDDDYQQEREVERRTTDQEQRELDEEQRQQLKRSRLQSKTNSQNQRSSKLVVATPTRLQKFDLSGQQREEDIDRLFDMTFGRQGTKRSSKKRKREKKEKRKNSKSRRKNLDEFALKG